MGVYRLWQILLTIANSKQAKDLSGLVLAIDASLWIVKVNSIYDQQSAQINCLFKKIIWLLKNNIKPIFVFDGMAPALKRKTLEDRRRRRRQLHCYQITKKVQLEILKKIQFPQGQSLKDNNAKNQLENKQKQIDEMLSQLLKAEEPTKPIELEQKVKMQGKVLDKKYELFLDIAPKIEQIHGSSLYFSELDIDTKLEILSQIEQEQLPSNKEIRIMKKQMTEQQKFIYDLELIRKKSEIRQLQNNLYRKVQEKKKQNGFEIIEGIYNGKKVVQKRKIREPRQGDYCFYKTKNAPKNDFKAIFKNKRENEEQIQKQKKQYSADQDDNNGDFFHKIFKKDYHSGNTESQSSLRSFSNRLSSQSSQINEILSDSEQCQIGNSLFKQRGKSHPNSQEYDFVDQFAIFREMDEQNKIKKQQKSTINKNQQFQRDPDNFPDFLKINQLDPLGSTTNNNVQLQNILDILGITYVIAPAEAQAECASLQIMGLVDGVVTEDSDVFLFGARKVYRGIFQENIKLYSMNIIESKLHLSREKLILFAMMLGSDYSDGIKGIGLVNAMEILKVHESFESLKKFTQWAKTADAFQDEEYKTQSLLKNNISQGQKQFYQLHRKYKNYWHIHPKFPDLNVFNAYMKPDVLEKKNIVFKEERKMELIEDIMREKFNMSEQEIKHNLKILKKPFSRIQQTSMTQFLEGGQYAKIRSKRLEKAIK